MISYSIKEQAPNVKDIKIVKTGGEIEFTIGNIEADVAYLQKAKKEFEGKMGVEKATMENVARTHPHIAAMTPEDLVAAYLYKQSAGYVTIATEKLAEIEKQLAEYDTEKAEILKQTGIVLPVEETK